MALQDAAIVAYAETKIVEVSDVDVWELSAQVLEELLDKTGLDKREIDGLLLSSSQTGAGHPFWSQTTADQLGLEVDHCSIIDIGGGAPAGAVARAAAAIDAGLCNVVLCLYSDTRMRENNYRARGHTQEWTSPVGLMGAPGGFGLLMKRYEHQFGLDFRALGKLAVTQREHALLNDLACDKLRKRITIDDYINSRMVTDPVRLLDSVMLADGACGLIVMSRKMAEKKGYMKCVVPIGYGERTNFNPSEAVVDITMTGHKPAGEKAFKQAGLTPKDIKSYHPYDDFIIAIMMQLEMMGFCKHGQGCDFVNATDFMFNGDLPLNTGGGQISGGQIGLAGGGTNLIEAVRQLFGEGGKRQVRNTENALVTGIGWIPYGRNWATSVVMILTPNS